MFLATDARVRMRELGYKAPDQNYRKHVIMGREFDAAAADAYLSSFPISRAS